MATQTALAEVPAAAPPTAVSSGVPCMNCGKPAVRTNTCKLCQDMKIPGAMFCTPTCYRDNYKTHKKLHKVADPGQYVFPEGTKEGFNGKYTYTGPLRAVYPIEPVPKRVVPDTVTYPDYAKECETLLSIPERWSAVWGGSVLGKAEEIGRTIHWGLRDAVANRTERSGKILNKEEIAGMREVCRLGREVLDIAAAMVAPGVTTLEIDAVVHEECMKRNAYPSPLGYHMFPRSVCTSINETICHGIPDARPLVDGDIVNLDISLYYGGFHGDLNATYPVGTKVSAENLSLIATARKCLDEAIRVCRPGYQFQDLGKIIEGVAKANGFSVNRTYGGHGINQLFHCMPNVSHYAGNRNPGTMKPGMTFTIEPMLCAGQQKETHWPDNWTAVTIDGKPSAQFEETLLVTATGIEVLTAAPGWKLPEVESKA